MPYKHDYDKILKRLTTILSRLNDGESLSVKELAKEFNKSERTIQRDFNERLISFPIYQENKKWKMQDGFKLEKVTSIEDEVVLDIIEKITQSIGGKFATKSHHLLSKIKNENFNPIYTKLNIEDISDKLKEIQLLQKAILTKNEIQCRYDDEKHPPYLTTIQPLKIVNFEGFWYLLGLREGILKKYYLKNISNCKMLDDTFIIDKSIDKLLDDALSIWFQQDSESFEVKLYANKYASKYFKRRPLPTQYIEKQNSDGSIEFSIKITHKMEILPIIKYWIPHLYILKPKWLKEIIKKDISSYQEVMKEYEN